MKKISLALKLTHCTNALADMGFFLAAVWNQTGLGVYRMCKPYSHYVGVLERDCGQCGATAVSCVITKYPLVEVSLCTNHKRSNTCRTVYL